MGNNVSFSTRGNRRMIQNANDAAHVYIILSCLCVCVCTCRHIHVPAHIHTYLKSLKEAAHCYKYLYSHMYKRVNAHTDSFRERASARYLHSARRASLSRGLSMRGIYARFVSQPRFFTVLNLSFQGVPLRLRRSYTYISWRVHGRKSKSCDWRARVSATANIYAACMEVASFFFTLLVVRMSCACSFFSSRWTTYTAFFLLFIAWRKARDAQLLLINN